MREHSWLC